MLVLSCQPLPTVLLSRTCPPLPAAREDHASHLGALSPIRVFTGHLFSFQVAKWCKCDRHEEAAATVLSGLLPTDAPANGVLEDHLHFH